MSRDRETNLAKGFAFISFADRESAARALERLDGREYIPSVSAVIGFTMLTAPFQTVIDISSCVWKLLKSRREIRFWCNTMSLLSSANLLFTK